jgi:histidine triad (HIT) family protein
MEGLDVSCIFCRIIRGELPAKKVYEDNLTVAFWDSNPAAPIHILVVPKNHIPTLNDVSETDMVLSHLGQVARKIARDFGVEESGYRFFVNVGREGGQVIFHLHVHLLAGNDLGVLFVRLAIGAGILWRKLRLLFRGGPWASD